MEKPSNKEIAIRPVGSYFETDAEGYVINPTSKEKIQENWKAVIDDLIELYKKTYGDKLKSVYIRGSVAKGEAVDGISDLDSFAYVDLSKEEISGNKSYKEGRKGVEEKYPFVESVEFEGCPLEAAKDDTVLLNQSLCVYGEPEQYPKLKTGKEMAIHAPTFHNRFKWFEEFSSEEHSEERNKEVCVWLMKGLLRTGFELVMERSKKYTRDLYPCYEGFSKYYPEKESEMKEVLHYALNPTGDINKIKVIQEDIGQFVLSEIPKYFEVR